MSHMVTVTMVNVMLTLFSDDGLCNVGQCDDHIIVTAIITPASQCDDHFDTLLMVGVMIIFGHMVSVMITSKSDDSQHDNGQSSHETMYAATVWQCDCVRSDSVTATVYTAAVTVTATVYTVRQCDIVPVTVYTVTV